VDVGKQDDDLAAEDLTDVSTGDGQELVHAARAGQLPAHGIERGRPLLPLAGRQGLGPDAHGQGAGHESDEQHHDEGDDVSGVRDREGEKRRDEEEIEGGDAERGGQ
jgi:hypothetical protein